MRDSVHLIKNNEMINNFKTSHKKGKLHFYFILFLFLVSNLKLKKKCKQIIKKLV